MGHWVLGGRHPGTTTSYMRDPALTNVSQQGAVPTAFNAWLPIEPFMHCIDLVSPKVLMLDSERLHLLSPHLPVLRLPVILVRPSSPQHSAGSRVREWTRVLESYTGSNTAWQKEPEILPDDNATVSFVSYLNDTRGGGEKTYESKL